MDIKVLFKLCYLGIWNDCAHASPDRLLEIRADMLR
jgi:hypothetical protein